MSQKVLIWDLETGGVNAFKADLGFIICFGYKWLGEKRTKVLTVNQYPKWFSKKGGGVNDLGLLRHALAIMEKADLTVAHYGERFDRRFFQGRCVINGLLPPPPTKMRDTWRIAKTAFSFQSNRLGDLARILGLPEQKHQKTREEWPGWWHRAAAGDSTVFQEIGKYCAQDVRTTEQVYLRIRQYDEPHPRLVPIEERVACRLCGGEVVYRGYSYLGIYRYRRYFCKTCGRWDRNRYRSK